MNTTRLIQFTELHPAGANLQFVPCNYNIDYKSELTMINKWR